MKLSEFGSRMAHIDLSAGSVEMRPAPEDWLRKYVGGRGLGVRYVLENGPDVDPLSPANILCFLNGPLSGSETNMSGRWAAVTRSPLTGTVTDSHQGGWTAARLRWAGIRRPDLRGARRASGVRLRRRTAEIEHPGRVGTLGKGHPRNDASSSSERHGEEDLSVCAIGPAGENLVRFASWLNEDDRAFGRGGTGAVGGSKNLKAIVIRSPRARRADVDDAEAWKRVRREAVDAIRDPKPTSPAPRRVGLSVYGTNVLMNIASNAMGALPTRNSQLTSFGERAEVHRRRVCEGEPPDRRPHLPRLSDGLQEGGGDQGRSLRGSKDGERRVRVRLGSGRQLRQRRTSARSPS